MLSVKVESPTSMLVVVVQVVLHGFGVGPGFGVEAHVDIGCVAISPGLGDGHVLGEGHLAIQADVTMSSRVAIGVTGEPGPKAER